MKERPILFSAPMVRALLDGRKTQTRRVVKHGALGANGPCPYGAPGDRLWVRETHAIYHAHGQHRADGERWGPWGGLPTQLSPDRTQIAYYRAGFDRCDPGRWRPSTYMPRWASRLTLEVTAVRVERLRDISEENAIAEGVEQADTGPLRWVRYRNYMHEREAQGIATSFASPRESFFSLWESINGTASLSANPWVWVVSFRRVEP